MAGCGGGGARGTPRAAGDGDAEPDQCAAAGAGSCPAAGGALHAGSLALGQRRALIAAGPASCAPRLGLQTSPGMLCFVPWGALLRPLGCPAPSSLPPVPRACQAVESNGSSGWFGELERPTGSARRVLALPASPPLGEDVERKDGRQKGFISQGFLKGPLRAPGDTGAARWGQAVLLRAQDASSWVNGQDNAAATLFQTEKLGRNEGICPKWRRNPAQNPGRACSPDWRPEPASILESPGSLSKKRRRGAGCTAAWQSTALSAGANPVFPTGAVSS